MHCKEIYTCCLGVDFYFTGISVRIFLKPEKIAKFSKAQRKLAVLKQNKLQPISERFCMVIINRYL